MVYLRRMPSRLVVSQTDEEPKTVATFRLEHLTGFH